MISDVLWLSNFFLTTGIHFIVKIFHTYISYVKEAGLQWHSNIAVTPALLSVGPFLLLQEVRFIHSLAFNLKSSRHLNPKTLSVISMSSLVYSSKPPTLFKAKALPLPHLPFACVRRAGPKWQPFHTDLSWVLQRSSHLKIATKLFTCIFWWAGYNFSPQLLGRQLDTSSILSIPCQNPIQILPTPRNLFDS